jgi:hypothetical protein
VPSASLSRSTVCAGRPLWPPPLTRLPALTALHRLKTGNERVNADAREAVKWLDDITSTSTADVADRVQLEGVDEAYATWDHVAKFLLPETLLSMDDSESDDDDDYHEDLESSFNALEMSDETSVSSTHSLDHAPRTPESPRSSSSRATKRTQAIVIESPNGANRARATKLPKSAVPPYLQPLFNHVLWRINNESNPDAALVSFILLTNDPTKQAIAQKFGIRAKRLEQLRDTVAREDREYKNHLTLYKIELESTTAKENPPPPTKAQDPPKAAQPEQDDVEVNSDDEDVVLFQRAPRGPAQPASNQRVWDPNDFARTTPQASPRGGRGGQAASRGRGGSAARGRGTFTPRGGAYVAPAPAFRAPPVPRHDPNQPIDPNSFARPGPRASPVRGGGRRKLWEPN